MNLLVIGSCTDHKDIRGCPSPLSEADFEDPALLKHREAELARWALPAGRLYTGRQHRYMMNGVALLRRRFGLSTCSVKIISAGYGLVAEDQLLVPYEATFQHKSRGWICRRARQLAIPEAVREAVHGHECVVFLLGEKYLLSIQPLPLPSPGQRLIFFTSASELALSSDLTIIPAGKAEGRFGAVMTALKGKMFELLAAGLCLSPELWEQLLSDESSRTALSLIEIGQAHGSH
jgi:hypothetical protein